MELRRLRLVLSAAVGCPASGDVPGPRGYVAGQSGVVSSVLMSPFFMCVLPVTPFRMNESRSSQAKPSQAKPRQDKPSQAKPSQSVKWGRRLGRRASRRPPVC